MLKNHRAPFFSHSNKDALRYLRLWKEDRDSWKFQKIRQSFLLKYTFNPFRLPKPDFKIFLEYIVALKGAARDRLLEEARAIVEGRSSKSDEGDGNDGPAGTDKPVDSSQEGNDSDDEEKKQKKTEEQAVVEKIRAHRAKKILQVLG